MITPTFQTPVQHLPGRFNRICESTDRGGWLCGEAAIKFGVPENSKRGFRFVVSRKKFPGASRVYLTLSCYTHKVNWTSSPFRSNHGYTYDRMSNALKTAFPCLDESWSRFYVGVRFVRPKSRR